MEDLPAIELIENNHEFPGPYVFKVIGLVENGFVARVIAAVRDELEQDVDPPFRVRQSTGGKHISITLEPTIQTAQQVLNVYRCIRKQAGLEVLW